MRELVHEPMKTVSTGISRIGVPGAEAHVGERPLGRVALVRRRVDGSGSGTTPSMRRHLGGVGAPGDVRQRASSRRWSTILVEGRALVGGQGPPVGDGVVPVLADGARGRGRWR